MARKEISMEELIEVLYQWHMGRSISQMKRSVGMDRKTIRKYLELAQRYGLSREMDVQGYAYYLALAGRIQQGLKTPLASCASYKKTAFYQHTIEKLLSKKYITPKQVYQILKREYAYPLSYSSFKRYMRITYPKEPRHCLRIEVGAGQEGQVDFGSAGMLLDPESGKRRRAHAFVLTLSYSRLAYVEFVFDQGQMSWVRCHMNAFEFFAGVPDRIILDNLKSGILKPNTYDPIFNRTYGECAKHYGFIIDPAKARKAAHKGKVERRIPVVRQQFLACYEFRDIREANEQVKDYCRSDYGLQIHGTTKRKPYEVFTTEEQPQLKHLPPERFDLPVWKEAKVHPDHHVVFEKSYYSLPTRYVSKKVWVRGGVDTVRIFSEGELIKTHSRACHPGTWQTDERDYPPEKSRYLLKSRSYYQREASRYGEYVEQVVSHIMHEHAYRNLRKVQAIFRLVEKYGSEAVNLSCQRCLVYEDYRMSTIKRILTHQLYTLPVEEEVMSPKASSYQQEFAFIRPAAYFIHTKEERV